MLRLSSMRSLGAGGLGVRKLCTPAKQWRVYLSGEIHSDWREQIAGGVKSRNLPITISSPNPSHEDSDDCAAIILGMEEQRPNWDRIGAQMNAIRTRTLLEEADVVVVKFGDKYRQWNAAFDAGYAAAKGKSLIVLHPKALGHMLKEVNAAASAVCEEPHQVVETLDYRSQGDCPHRETARNSYRSSKDSAKGIPTRSDQK